MKKLISMTAFVKEQLNEENSRTKPMREVFNSLENYANFLSLTPEIWQFVPCDSDGNVLEEPSSSQEKYSNYNIFQTIFDDKLYYNDLTEYQRAKERCYFERWEYDGAEEGFTYIKKDDILLVFDTENKTLMLSNKTLTDNICTIEDLIDYNLTLTATAQKEIGL